MRIIEPSFEIIEQAPNLEGLYKHIELCGRNAYKSEDKITEDSAKTFVDKICKLKHESVLEHGTVYLKLHWEYEICRIFDNLSKFYFSDKYSKIRKVFEKYDLCPTLYVTTNYRVLKENNRLEDLQYLCEPTQFHEKRVSVRFICSRAISHELVRHRTFSFIQESQRYCNYSKDKFNNGITFIKPLWLQSETQEGCIILNSSDLTPKGFGYIDTLKECEESYLNMLDFGMKPEEAREVLPNSTKTEIIMTGFISDWEYFFGLRTADNAHPEMKRLTIPLKEEFIKKGYMR